MSGAELLNKTREQIDELDNTIWSLLEKRFGLLKEVVQIKRDFNIPVLDEKREEAVLSRINTLNCDPEVITAIAELYKVLFALSRKYQKN